MGSYHSIEDRIQNVCKRNEVKCQIEYTKHRHHAITLAKDSSKHGFDYVIAVGGDGTINEVAQGLLDTNTVMGILPRGSGNGLARHFGISSLLPSAIDSLFDNRVVRMDTMLMNSRLSLNVSGIGFDGHIANLFANRKIRGLFGYARLILREMFRFPEFDSEIIIDGKAISSRAFIIALANSSQYGNNFKIAPLASVLDGVFDITIMKKVSIMNMGVIYSLLKGELANSSQCNLMKCAKATISTSRPVPYHIDGEPCGSDTNFTIQMQPSSLSVLVPQHFTQQSNAT